MPKITRLVHYHRPFRFAAFNFEIKLHRNDLLSKWKGKKKTAFAFKEKKNSPIKYYVNVLWVIVICNKSRGGGVQTREMRLCLRSFLASSHCPCWLLSPHSQDPLAQLMPT